MDTNCALWIVPLTTIVVNDDDQMDSQTQTDRMTDGDDGGGEIMILR